MAWPNAKNRRIFKLEFAHKERFLRKNQLKCWIKNHLQPLLVLRRVFKDLHYTSFFVVHTENVTSEENLKKENRRGACNKKNLIHMYPRTMEMLPVSHYSISCLFHFFATSITTYNVATCTNTESRNIAARSIELHDRTKKILEWKKKQRDFVFKPQQTRRKLGRGGILIYLTIGRKHRKMARPFHVWKRLRSRSNIFMPTNRQ